MFAQLENAPESKPLSQYNHSQEDVTAANLIPPQLFKKIVESSSNAAHRSIASTTSPGSGFRTTAQFRGGDRGGDRGGLHFTAETHPLINIFRAAAPPSGPWRWPAVRQELSATVVTSAVTTSVADGLASVATQNSNLIIHNRGPRALCTEQVNIIFGVAPRRTAVRPPPLFPATRT
ncbi:hypothetical protein EVAR_17530_1 [Eumeta japonica]|uniref:Uncharacterized protein n=1 Tax=Eumeta variegata TaxID=151549 RepID=A0A4C1WTM3_EUMVA|nr:hypothetical protein EVAR_17530_1 [Eumeta japonica]